MESKHTYNEESIPYCFNIVNELDKSITICNGFPTTQDENNIQVRYFCEEHMIKVENIRRKMAQKYTKEYKENLIGSLNIILNSDIEQYNTIDIIKILINKIKCRKFD